MGRREINVEIFEDSVRLQKENAVLKESIKKSMEGQVLYLEHDQIPACEQVKKTRAADIAVSMKRTLEAAKAYSGKKVCVLNFASATNPGGGVTKGSSAQEECLCRCSTLYPNLNAKDMWDGFYKKHRALQNPIYNDDCIYTPGIMVYKTDTSEPKLMSQSEWYQVNVITCAAPNLRAKPGNAMNLGAGTKPAKLSQKELKEIHLKRGRRIFEIAKAHGNEVLILGAFGCGAFRNPPFVVAQSYRELVEEYKQDFDVIEFAVYCPPRDTENYDVFKRVIR